MCGILKPKQTLLLHETKAITYHERPFLKREFDKMVERVCQILTMLNAHV